MSRLKPSSSKSSKTTTSHDKNKRRKKKSTPRRSGSAPATKTSSPPPTVSSATTQSSSSSVSNTSLASMKNSASSVTSTTSPSSGTPTSTKECEQCGNQALLEIGANAKAVANSKKVAAAANTGCQVCDFVTYRKSQRHCVQCDRTGCEFFCEWCGQGFHGKCAKTRGEHVDAANGFCCKKCEAEQADDDDEEANEINAKCGECEKPFNSTSEPATTTTSSKGKQATANDPESTGFKVNQSVLVENDEVLYNAVITDVDAKHERIKIHFLRWSKSFDDWYAMDDEHINESLACDCCNRWFHIGCLPPIKSSGRFKDTTYVCPTCLEDAKGFYSGTRSTQTATKAAKSSVSGTSGSSGLNGSGNSTGSNGTTSSSRRKTSNADEAYVAVATSKKRSSKPVVQSDSEDDHEQVEEEPEPESLKSKANASSSSNSNAKKSSSDKENKSDKSKDANAAAKKRKRANSNESVASNGSEKKAKASATEDKPAVEATAKSKSKKRERSTSREEQEELDAIKAATATEAEEMEPEEKQTDADEQKPAKQEPDSEAATDTATATTDADAVKADESATAKEETKPAPAGSESPFSMDKPSIKRKISGHSVSALLNSPSSPPREPSREVRNSPALRSQDPPASSVRVKVEKDPLSLPPVAAKKPSNSRAKVWVTGRDAKTAKAAVAASSTASSSSAPSSARNSLSAFDILREVAAQSMSDDLETPGGPTAAAAPAPAPSRSTQKARATAAERRAKAENDKAAAATAAANGRGPPATGSSSSSSAPIGVGIPMNSYVDLHFAIRKEMYLRICQLEEERLVERETAQLLRTMIYPTSDKFHDLKFVYVVNKDLSSLQLTKRLLELVPITAGGTAPIIPVMPSRPSLATMQSLHPPPPSLSSSSNQPSLLAGSGSSSAAPSPVRRSTPSPAPDQLRSLPSRTTSPAIGEFPSESERDAAPKPFLMLPTTSFGVASAIDRTRSMMASMAASLSSVTALTSSMPSPKIGPPMPPPLPAKLLIETMHLHSKLPTPTQTPSGSSSFTSSASFSTLVSSTTTTSSTPPTHLSPVVPSPKPQPECAPSLVNNISTSISSN